MDHRRLLKRIGNREQRYVHNLNSGFQRVVSTLKTMTQIIKMFILATDHLLLLPDPKMGFLPFSAVDAHMLRKEGGYFIGWWIHPNFLADAWWKVNAQ